MTANTDNAANDAGAGRSLALPVLLIYAIFVAAQSQLFFDMPRGVNRMDNDNLMRLVQVRDLLAGQGWFDLMQYRLGPDGTLMHWSRIIDAPIAGLILLFRQFVGPEAAEWAAFVIWPLLVALPLLAALAIAGRAMGGYAAGIVATALGLGAILQSAKFRPGSLDHHNVQMALLAIAIAGLLTRKSGLKPMVITGLSVAASLSIGIETAPQNAAIMLTLAVLWVAEGSEADRRTVTVAAALGAGLLTLWLVATPPANRFYPSCDINSIALIAPGIAGSAGLALMARFVSASIPRRAAGLALLAIVVLVIAAAMPGSCLRNPLDSLDPLLQERWLAHIVEARSAFYTLPKYWQHLIGAFVAPLIAIAACLFLARKGQAGSALGLALLIALSYAATFYQVRGLVPLGFVSIPPLAAVIAWAYRRYRQSGRLAHGVATLALLAASLPTTWGMVAYLRVGFYGLLYLVIAPPDPVTADSTPPPSTPAPAALGPAEPPLDCHSTSLYAELAALPRGLVSANNAIGTPILAATHHRVMSAPYHRNQAGMIAQLRIEDAKAPEAEAILRQHEVDYIVLCTQRTPKSLTDDATLIQRLYFDPPPDWLKRLSPVDSPIIIYRLEPPASG